MLDIVAAFYGWLYAPFVATRVCFRARATRLGWAFQGRLL